MVQIVTSFGRSGLHDWLIQRLSAVYLVCYFIYLLCFFLLTPNMDFTIWQAKFAQLPMKIATIGAFLAICLHAWVGAWIVSTDYLKNTCVRLLFQIVVILTLLTSLFWSVLVLWGVN